MKKIFAALFILISISQIANAGDLAYDLSKEADMKSQMEQVDKHMDRIVEEVALMTNVQLNCSRDGKRKIKQLISNFSRNLGADYENIFSCEVSIRKALDAGISELEIREELGL